MRYRRTQQAGFSLVEILIAFFVLMIGILAILTLFPLGLRESKQMVDTSIASLVARNARGMMEVHPFTYKAGSDTKKGNGTASMIHIRFGCDIAQALKWVKTFPEDLLANDDDRTFPKTRTENVPFYRERKDKDGKLRYDKIFSSEHPQYCWDARFTIGRGIGETQVGENTLRMNPPPGQIYEGPDGWRDFSENDMRAWFERYYRYYAVQISIYRNYDEVVAASGQIALKADKRPDGSAYDNDDPNRPLYSELILKDAPIEIQANWHIRVTKNECQSDWYRIERMNKRGAAQFVFRLDRPFAPMVGAIGTQAEIEWSVTNIVATSSLIEHFTTMLGSQLDDTDTGNLSVTDH